MNVCFSESFPLDDVPGGFRPYQGQSGQSLAPPVALGKPSEPAAADAAALGKTAAAAAAAAAAVVVVLVLVSGGKICIQLLSSSPCN